MSYSVAVCCCVHLCLFWRGRERRRHAPFFSFVRERARARGGLSPNARERNCESPVRCGRRESSACTFLKGKC